MQNQKQKVSSRVRGRKRTEVELELELKEEGKTNLLRSVLDNHIGLVILEVTKRDENDVSLVDPDLERKKVREGRSARL